MALSDKRIEELRKCTFSTDYPFCPVDRKSMWKAAKAIEAEVRKKDEALIRQLVDALGNSSAMEFQNVDAANLRHKAIEAGRARLKP